MVTAGTPEVTELKFRRRGAAGWDDRALIERSPFVPSRAAGRVRGGPARHTAAGAAPAAGGVEEARASGTFDDSPTGGGTDRGVAGQGFRDRRGHGWKDGQLHTTIRVAGGHAARIQRGERWGGRNAGSLRLAFMRIDREGDRVPLPIEEAAPPTSSREGLRNVPVALASPGTMLNAKCSPGRSPGGGDIRIHRRRRALQARLEPRTSATRLKVRRAPRLGSGLGGLGPAYATGGPAAKRAPRVMRGR